MTKALGRLRSHPSLPVIMAMLALFAASGLRAQDSGTIAGKSGRALALPPAAQFLEGDKWNAYDPSASETAEILGKKVNVLGRVLVKKKQGRWVVDDNDTIDNATARIADPYVRVFSDPQLEPANFPKSPREGELHASPDGILHQFQGGRWQDVPIGETLAALRGDRILIDSRMTGGQANDLNGPAKGGVPVAIVPAIDQEVRGLRIGWANNSDQAVRAAQKDGKPVVAVFTGFGANAKYSNLFVTHVLRCSVLNTLAGQAHFALLTPYLVPDTSTTLARSLGIENVPALSVLSVKGASFDERARSTGAGNEAEVLETLQKAGLKPGAPGPTAATTMPLGTMPPGGCLPAKDVRVATLPEARVIYNNPAEGATSEPPAPVASVDPAIVGTWELPLLTGRWILEIGAKGTFAFHSEANDGSPARSGTFLASNGQWSLHATDGYDDGGTYTVQSPSLWVATSKRLGPGTWRRVNAQR